MTTSPVEDSDSPYEKPFLSPVDVHHVAFNKPPIGQRGYNEDEVDQFLDLIEEDILRYRSEIEKLRDTIAELTAQNKQLESDYEIALAQQKSAPQPVAENPADAEYKAVGARTARILEMAQITADNYEKEAKGKYDQTVAEATVKSQRLISEATADAEKVLQEAQTRANTILDEAKNKSESQVKEAERTAYKVVADAQRQADTVRGEAEKRAAELKAEAEKNHKEVMGTITEQRNALESRIDRLKVFENEYRTRLRGHIETHLETLKSYDDPVQPEENI